MGHVPHLHLPPGWSSERIPLSGEQEAHLARVLRVRDGAPVTYTDGEGTIGHGTLSAAAVIRGPEELFPRPTSLSLAVAPPKSRDRQRFLVEKLAEIGVARLAWMKARYGNGKAPHPTRARSWARSALEQSRGAWMMTIAPEVVGWEALEGPVVVCSSDGSEDPPEARTVVIGPEGGWAPDEIPESLPRWSLGPTILRVETAAMAAAVKLR